MRRWRNTANASFYGLRRDRFMQYQPPRSVEERIEAVGKTPGIDGIELKYPFDFQNPADTKARIEDAGLKLSAVNVDTREMPFFRFGGLTNPDPKMRDLAVQRLAEGMDCAAEFGTDIVTTCPVGDGYDYPFQLDYTDAWGWFIDTTKRAAQHRGDIKLCLEYQPHEPHAKILLSNVGKMLHVCHAVGLPNLGANLDIGHSFAALEAPAESAALLASENRLFYLHASDNTGDGGDWDMLSGTVHFWHWLELLLTLDKVGYDGWMGADILPKFQDAETFYDCNARMIESMCRLLETLGEARLREMIARNGTTPDIYNLIAETLAAAPEPVQAQAV